MGKKWEKQSPKFHILDWEHWRLPSGFAHGQYLWPGVQNQCFGKSLRPRGAYFPIHPLSRHLSHLQHIIDRKIVRCVALVDFGRWWRSSRRSAFWKIRTMKIPAWVHLSKRLFSKDTNSAGRRGLLRIRGENIKIHGFQFRWLHPLQLEGNRNQGHR